MEMDKCCDQGFVSLENQLPASYNLCLSFQLLILCLAASSHFISLCQNYNNFTQIANFPPTLAIFKLLQVPCQWPVWTGKAN